MNAMEQLLQEDLNRLIDRLATMDDSRVGDCLARRPDLLSQLTEIESRVSSVRLALVAGYAAWREALAECDDLWALAELGGEPAGERRAA
jgi:hypothetical protein